MIGAMSTAPTPDDETVAQHREQLRHVAAVRDSEPRVALAALRAGVRQVDIAADLNRTREHVRRITRQAEDAEQRD